MPDTDLLRRSLPIALILLLVAVWLGGGVTIDPSGADEVLQLLALPVLAMAAALLILDGLPSALSRVAVAVAAMVALVPALQLLPVPQGFWNSGEARLALQADLASVGVTLAPHWTLSPHGSERALWALLPALAAFLAAITLEGRARRLLLKTILVLVLVNVLFAFFQAGLPQDSALRLYRDFNAGFGGLLVNTNHMATALIIGMVIAVGLATQDWRRREETPGKPLHWARYAAAAAACLLLVPLSTSRAGMSLALPALALALLFSGAVPMHTLTTNRRVALGVVGAAVLAVIGIRAAMGWMAVDQAEEVRHALATATGEMARAHAPLGSGMGSFIEVFAQGAPDALQLVSYVNHAHNEYVQWMLAGGWLALLALLAVTGVLLVAGWRIVRLRGHGSDTRMAAVAFVAILAVLAHSVADYPLRTLTLMTTTAALAGLMFAALADARRRRPAPTTPSLPTATA